MFSFDLINYRTPLIDRRGTTNCVCSECSRGQKKVEIGQTSVFEVVKLL